MTQTRDALSKRCTAAVRRCMAVAYSDHGGWVAQVNGGRNCTRGEDKAGDENDMDRRLER